MARTIHLLRRVIGLSSEIIIRYQSFVSNDEKINDGPGVMLNMLIGALIFFLLGPPWLNLRFSLALTIYVS